MIRTITAAAVLAVASTGAFAATVDFEDEFPLTPDPLNVGTSYSNGGITFTSGDGNDLYLVEAGAPVDAFVPGDNVESGADFGEVFLTGDFNLTSAVTMSFAQTTEMFFEIADIDGSGSQQEIFSFDVLLNGLSVDTFTISSGDADTGNAIVTNIAITGLLFDEVQISNTTAGGGNNRNIGWGLDNIYVAAVPLPAGLVFSLTALGGLGALRLRKRKA